MHAYVSLLRALSSCAAADCDRCRELKRLLQTYDCRRFGFQPPGRKVPRAIQARRLA